MTRPRTERRAHKRLELACPTIVVDAGGRELLQTQTLNISDGGALLASEADHGFRPGQSLAVALRVPRSTPNTYMLEDFSIRAHVVRCRDAPETGHSEARFAVRFAEPLDLHLEV